MSWTIGKITTATTEGGKDKNYNKMLAQMLLKEFPMFIYPRQI